MGLRKVPWKRKSAPPAGEQRQNRSGIRIRMRIGAWPVELGGEGAWPSSHPTVLNSPWFCRAPAASLVGLNPPINFVTHILAWVEAKKQ